MRKLFFIFLIVFSSLNAQMVFDYNLPQTIKTDGLFVDVDGTLYITTGWSGNKVYKHSVSDGLEVFATGLSGPIDILKASNGYFYVSNWNTSTVSKIDSNGVIVKNIQVSGGPGPMCIGHNSEIYVTHNINAGTGSIYRILPDDSSELFAAGGSLQDPGGIDMDSKGYLWVANFYNGKVSKVDTSGNVEHVTTLPSTGQFKSGHLKIKDDIAYISAISENTIYKVENGIPELFAGKKFAGHQNGSLDEAVFKSPNGIEFNKEKTKLFIANGLSNTSYLQYIDFNAVVSVEREEELLPTEFEVYQNFPNPFNPETTISFSVPVKSDVTIQIFDTLGQKIMTLAEKAYIAGYQSVKFDGSDLPSGMYIYRIRAAGVNGESHVSSRIMLLIK